MYTIEGSDHWAVLSSWYMYGRLLLNRFWWGLFHQILYKSSSHFSISCFDLALICFSRYKEPKGGHFLKYQNIEVLISFWNNLPRRDIYRCYGHWYLLRLSPIFQPCRSYQILWGFRLSLRTARWNSWPLVGGGGGGGGWRRVMVFCFVQNFFYG